MLSAEDLTDEQIIEATSFDPRVRETNVELIQLRARALTGIGRGDDVTPEMRAAARARCAEILEARRKEKQVTITAENLTDDMIEALQESLGSPDRDFLTFDEQKVAAMCRVALIEGSRLGQRARARIAAYLTARAAKEGT